MILPTLFLILGIIWWIVDCLPNRLLIITSNGQDYAYRVEIADTDTKREQGLMHRNNLPSDCGMLFIFPRINRVYMWMKDTYIPLDMLFINPDNKIVSIYENASPLDEGIISSQIPVNQVLELNAGEVKKHHFKIGDHIRVEKQYFLDFFQ